MAVGTVDRTYLLKSRTRVAFGCVLLGYSALMGRLVYLQGVRGASMRALAVGKRTGKIALPARRGGIYDRTGAPCAMSVATANIGFDPSQYANHIRRFNGCRRHFVSNKSETHCYGTPRERHSLAVIDVALLREGCPSAYEILHRHRAK